MEDTSIEALTNPKCLLLSLRVKEYSDRVKGLLIKFFENFSELGP